MFVPPERFRTMEAAKHMRTQTHIMRIHIHARVHTVNRKSPEISERAVKATQNLTCSRVTASRRSSMRKFCIVCARACTYMCEGIVRGMTRNECKCAGHACVSNDARSYMYGVVCNYCVLFASLILSKIKKW